MALSQFSLITVDQLRDYMGLTGTGGVGNLEAAANAAIRMIERRQNREWVTRGPRYEFHTVRHPRRCELRLAQFPARTVTSVWESLAVPPVYDATTLLVEGTDYTVDHELGILTRITGAGAAGYWRQGERAIRVLRTAGFTAPWATTDAAGAYTAAQARDELGELIRWQLEIAAGMYKRGDEKAWGDTDNTDAMGSSSRALAFLSAADRDELDGMARVEWERGPVVEAVP